MTALPRLHLHRHHQRSAAASHTSCLLLVSLLVLAALASAAHHGSSRTSSHDSSDLAALLAVRASLQDPHGALSSWIVNANGGGGGGSDAVANNYCAGGWVGVSCDSSGRITALHLPNKGLQGKLPTEIGLLSSLRRLSLHDNAISGPIPSSVSSLHNLRGLFLFRNHFTGAVPPSFSPVLQALDLSANHLSGAIPPELASSSPFLRRLDLSSNNLSSLIPPSLASLSRLVSLDLSNNQLVGPIPPQLSQIPSLTTLDLSYNFLDGLFPTMSSSSAMSATAAHSMFFFASLVTLNLSHNALDGTLPARIGELASLRVLRLSNNRFSGSIPAELANITGLSSLDVSHNNFSGMFPTSLADLTNLTSLNCSYNDLAGEVPAKLASSFDASAFEGNVGLCGFSLASACATTQSSSAAASKQISNGTSPEAKAADARPTKNSGVLSVIVVVIGVLTILLLVACVCAAIILCCFRRSQARKARRGAAEEKATSQIWSAGSSADQKKEYYGAGGGGGGSDFGGRLVHFEGSLGFAADELLCATAEVLGKSTFGTVYKAALEDGNLVAVKRLRDGIVKSQKDFEAEVKLLGAIRHPNLLSLRAYYWGPKDEKLLIFDFVPGGSLASLIHARKPESTTPLTWRTRMKIAVGAARGLAHLHHHEKTIHGNLTSTNILLDADLNPMLSDFCLSRLMTQAANATVVAAAGGAGYMAPELTKLRKPTPKSDVYSLGVVMLELLTGKTPGTDLSSESAEGSEGAMDLPEWVAYMVKQQWSNEVFDVEIMSRGDEEELMKALKVAMACVKFLPMERPDVSIVVGQLEMMMPELKLNQ